MDTQNKAHERFVRVLNYHWRIFSLVRLLTNHLPEKVSTQFWFYYTTGRLLNLSKPKTLSDKINWLKLYDKQLAHRKYVDRASARQYVLNSAPECQLPRILLRSYDLTSEQWAALPDRFVLKASHGAGMVKIIKKKSEADLAAIQSLTRAWLSTDYSKAYREWVYEGLDRYVIAEEFLSDNNGEIPNDFKFYCLNGRTAFVCVDVGRFSEHRRSVFNRDFELLNVEHTYPKGEQIKRPIEYEKAREIAESLSAELIFSRIDLYLLDGGVYFGEITLIPSAGRLNIKPVAFDEEMGGLLDLTTIKH